MPIGFIGTGTISGAMVEGLSGLPEPPEIIVSPRSERISRKLAARFGNVRRATSNAEAATAHIVVLGMRPAQVDEAMAGLSFGAEQIVVSLIAGLSLADVQALAPHSRVARAVPMPGIARRTGPVTVYPDVREVADLFRPLGELFVVPDETRLYMGGLSAFMSSYFELQTTLIGAAMAAGAPEEDARRFVLAELHMLSETARATPAESFDSLAAEHQTKGGLNERVRQTLIEGGWFEQVPGALRDVTQISWKKLG